MSDAAQALLLGLRDAWRSRLLASSVRWTLGLSVGWLVLLAWPGLTFWRDALSWASLPWAGAWATGLSTVLQLVLVALIYAALLGLSVALLIVFVFMPRVRALCLQAYPALRPVAGGSLLGPVRLALRLAGWTALGAGVCVLVPVVGGLLFLLLSGYLNVRGLVPDALEDLASDDEVQAVVAAQQADMAGLGASLAVLSMVPVLGWLVPVVMAASVCHLSMRTLLRLRGFR